MKKIILYVMSVVLVCSCNRYQSAINATFPNTNHYTFLLKNTSTNNSVMYFYHLDKLVKEKKVSKYIVKDSMNLKLVDIFFSNKDTIVITRILALKEKKKIPSEQLFIANHSNKQDTVYLRRNGKLVLNKFVMIAQKTPLLGYNFYPLK